MPVVHASPGSVVYATALFEAVEAGGLDALREVGQALDAIGDTWREDRVLRGFFLSSEISSKDRRAAMDRFVGDRFPPLLGNFLKLLLERGRLGLVPEIATAYRAALDRRLKRVPVTLTTAVPVPEEHFQRWVEMLRGFIDGEPVVSHEVDPEIIAGAVIRAGDRVADGSARRRLSELRARIIERGTQSHALQS